MKQENISVLDRLLAIFEERDGYLFAQEREIRSLIEQLKAQRSTYHLAVEMGVSPAYLGAILRGDQAAGEAFRAALQRMRGQAEQRGETLPTIEQGGAA